MPSSTTIRNAKEYDRPAYPKASAATGRPMLPTLFSDRGAIKARRGRPTSFRKIAETETNTAMAARAAPAMTRKDDSTTWPADRWEMTSVG